MKYQLRKDLGATSRAGGVFFHVWAPFAKNVLLATPYDPYKLDNKLPMERDAEGYWSVFVKDVEPGQSYKYFIETADGDLLERNDPRARALTDSDNGASVVVGHDFDWGDDLFMPIPKDQQVIYELHIGTFNRPDPATLGTFRDAIEKLDYLSELGINMVELMPVTSMMAHSNGWGYAPNELFSIEAAYGGRHGLMEFVRACHDRGMGVIVDVVYNHVSPTSSMWNFDGWSNNKRGGVYFYVDERGDTPWGGRPDFGRPEVRQFILDNVLMWFSEYRVDGLRLDSTAYMRNTAGGDNNPAHDIGDAWRVLSEASALAHKVRPGAVMIAEDTSVNDYVTKPVSQGGCEFDAQWGLNFSHAIRARFGLPVPFPTDLAYELIKTYNGHPYERVIFSDSHDTAANGNKRLNESLSPGNAEGTTARQRQIVADALLCSAPGIPMFLQGQEFMQEGDFNDWKELEWNKVEQFAGIVAAHRDLIALKQRLSGLRGQQTAVFHDDHTNNVIGFRRWNEGDSDDVLVIANFGAGKFKDYVLKLPVAGTWYVEFNSTWKGYSQDFSELEFSGATTDENSQLHIPLVPYAVFILTREPSTV